MTHMVNAKNEPWVTKAKLPKIQKITLSSTNSQSVCVVWMFQNHNAWPSFPHSCKDKQNKPWHTWSMREMNLGWCNQNLQKSKNSPILAPIHSQFLSSKCSKATIVDQHSFIHLITNKTSHNKSVQCQKWTFGDQIKISKNPRKIQC